MFWFLLLRRLTSQIRDLFSKSASMYLQNHLADGQVARYFSKISVLGSVPRANCEYVLADLLLLCLFSQSSLANLLQNALRLMTQKSATFHSQHLLAESPQIGLRVISLNSASMISQFHLADLHQFALRLWIASSFSHNLIS